MLWPKTKLTMFLSFLDITVAMVTADKYLTKKKKKKKKKMKWNFTHNWQFFNCGSGYQKTHLLLFFP